MSGESEKKPEAMVVDTGVLVDLVRGWQPSRDFFEKNNQAMQISRLTLMELIKGSSSKLEQIRLLKQLSALDVNLVETDSKISETAGEIFSRYWLSHQIGIIDAFIAATALELKEKLVTRNRKHFKFIKGLTLLVPY